jgi:hypothetical protein
MDETRVHIRNRLTKECGGEGERGRKMLQIKPGLETLCRENLYFSPVP